MKNIWDYACYSLKSEFDQVFFPEGYLVISSHYCLSLTLINIAYYIKLLKFCCGFRVPSTQRGFYSMCVRKMFLCINSESASWEPRNNHFWVQVPVWINFRKLVLCFRVAAHTASSFKQQWRQSSITLSSPHEERVIFISPSQINVVPVYVCGVILWQHYRVSDWPSIPTTSFSVVLHPAGWMCDFSSVFLCHHWYWQIFTVAISFISCS